MRGEIACEFTVSVTLEHRSGKFAGREELEEYLIDIIERANANEVDGVGSDGDTVYEVTGWEVECAEHPKGKVKS